MKEQYKRSLENFKVPVYLGPPSQIYTKIH